MSGCNCDGGCDEKLRWINERLNDVIENISDPLSDPQDLLRLFDKTRPSKTIMGVKDALDESKRLGFVVTPDDLTKHSHAFDHREPPAKAAKFTDEQWTEMKNKLAQVHEKLSSCDGILAAILKERDPQEEMCHGHRGGWRITEYQITSTGIDVNDVYDFIFNLVQKQKTDLETHINAEPNKIKHSGIR